MLLRLNNGMGRYIDLTGKIFGRLKVLYVEEQRDKLKRIIWKCLCDCGMEIGVLAGSLTSGNTKSCGCLSDDARRANGHARLVRNSSFVNLFYRYIQGAKRRNLLFDLSLDDFRVLTSGNCYYCGKTPDKYWKTNTYSFPYLYNGVDRVDNSIGYNLENCVSCCKIWGIELLYGWRN
jgi:hypothetical protein